MRHFLLVLFFVTSSLYGDTWKIDSTAATGAKEPAPMVPARYWTCMHVSASGTVLRATPLAGTGAGSAVYDSAFNGTVTAYTDTQDFYAVFGQAPSGSLTLQQRYDAMIKLKWVSSYKVSSNEPQFSNSGPYDSSGNPTDSDGQPADPSTSTPTVKSYKGSITLTCPITSLEPRSFRVKGIEEVTYISIFDQVFTLNPGETRLVTVTHTSPFTLYAVEVVENLSADPELSNGSPEDMDKRFRPVGPLNAVPATPQITSPAIPGIPEVNDQRTAQAASNPQAAATHNTLSTSTSGATSKDVSDLDKNLTEEMKRGTNQVKESGDGIENAIGDSNKLLKDIRDGGSGDRSTGEDMQAPSSGSLSFVAGIPGQSTTLGSSLGNLVNSLGLGSQVGTGTLAFSFDFPILGSQQVNLETYSELIASVRDFLRWCLSIMFVWQAFSIIKEAFVK